MPVCESCEDGQISQALKDQHADCLQEMLLENYEEEIRQFRLTPLHAAIMESESIDQPLEVLKFLLAEPDTSVEDRDSLGRTAIHYAAANGQTEVLKALVESHNADIDSKDFRGQTGLHWAIQGWDWEEETEYKPCPDAVSYLLSVGCKVDQRDQTGRTPLLTLLSFPKCNGYRFDLVMEDFVETAMHLLDHGADFNAEVANGQTALDEAAQRCQPELLELLLKRGASGNVLPVFGVLSNLPQLVKEKEMRRLDEIWKASVLDDIVRCVSVMLDYGCDFPEEIYNDPSGEWVQGVLNFVFSVAGADYCTEECVEPLQDIVKFFADAGAEGTSLHDGYTPLQKACLLGEEWCTPSLVHRASVNIKGRGGETALHIAARKNQTEMVRSLLENGADRDLETKDKLGKTPLDRAQMWGSKESAEILTKWKERELHETRKRKSKLQYQAGQSKWSRL